MFIFNIFFLHLLIAEMQAHDFLHLLIYCRIASSGSAIDNKKIQIKTLIVNINTRFYVLEL